MDAAVVMPRVPERALARQELCRFLAGCYYEPGPEFVEERLFDSILAAAQRISPELAGHAQRLGAAFSAVPLQDLLVDYTRLFLGAPQALAKPYASVWLSGQPELMQESVVDLLRLYEQGGFDIDPGFNDLPDHVAVELEFLYLLTHQHNQAVARNDAEAVQAVEVLRTAFLAGHLGRWMGPFILAVHEHAQCEFYRELAEFTELFVRMEGQLPDAAPRH
ncbi:MAG: molecular chaperone TorD family protein [Rubrivivax sp.]|nr:molecular chaperone TorD family protein [Rubrivivax sp.]